jgi:hypothetical protein
VYNATSFNFDRKIANPTPDPLVNFGVGDSFGTTAGVFGNGSFAIGDSTDDDGSSIDVGTIYTYDA